MRGPGAGGLDLEAAAVLRSGHGTAYHALLQRGRFGRRMGAGAWRGGRHRHRRDPDRPAFRRPGDRHRHTDAKRAACRRKAPSMRWTTARGFLDRVKELTSGAGWISSMTRSARSGRNRCAAWRSAGGSGPRLLGGGPASPQQLPADQGLEAIGVCMGGSSEPAGSVAPTRGWSRVGAEARSGRDLAPLPAGAGGRGGPGGDRPGGDREGCAGGLIRRTAGDSLLDSSPGPQVFNLWVI